MPNDEKDPTALATTQPQEIEQAQPEQPEPSAIEKVAERISGLTPKIDPLAVVSAKSLAEVLPAKFYEGASALKLNDEDKAVLAELQDATDDDIEILPDSGHIYVEHIKVRRALCKVFGTEWVCIPGSAIAQDKMPKSMLVAQRWVLIVRECYVGEAIGAGNYYENNPKQNKTDAAETAQAEAIRRICAKSALGIYSNVFEKSTQRRWRRDNAVQVFVRKDGENVKMWRRKDAEPLTGEVKGSAKPETQEESNGRAVDQRARKAPSENDSHAPQEASTPNPVRPVPQEAPPVERKKEVAPAQPAPSGQMVSEPNFQVFKAGCIKKGLLTGADCTGAIALICETFKIAPPEGYTAATMPAGLKKLFMGLTYKQFNDTLMPKVREGK